MTPIVARRRAARKRTCKSVQPVRHGFVDARAQHALDFVPLVVGQVGENFLGRAPIARIVGIDGARQGPAGIVFAAKNRCGSAKKRVIQTMSFGSGRGWHAEGGAAVRPDRQFPELFLTGGAAAARAQEKIVSPDKISRSGRSNRAICGIEMPAIAKLRPNARRATAIWTQLASRSIASSMSAILPH